jgi:signal transduction histidine kinase
VHVDPAFVDPDKERSTAVFRILQELLTNVARHANATRVGIWLSDGDVIHLRVEDNGRGIDSRKFEHPRSLGFLGLRESVLAFDGTIEVEGREGQGTTARVAIPNRVIQTVFHA